jgi:hypothetical protein
MTAEGVILFTIELGRSLVMTAGARYMHPAHPLRE